MSELGHPSGHNIVAAVVGLCRNLERECIIEGVASSERLAILRRIGCRYFQGCLFGRPMPTAELLAALADKPPSPALTSPNPLHDSWAAAG